MMIGGCFGKLGMFEEKRYRECGKHPKDCANFFAKIDKDP